MNCRVATCPHADCEWQKIRKDGRVVCAFLSEATHPCEYRMTKRMNTRSDIQKGSSGYIIRTSSGVMKLGPSKVLESQILSGRVSQKAFERVDDKIKKNGVRHGGSVLCGLVKSRKKNKLMVDQLCKSAYFSGRVIESIELSLPKLKGGKELWQKKRNLIWKKRRSIQLSKRLTKLLRNRKRLNRMKSSLRKRRDFSRKQKNSHRILCFRQARKQQRLLVSSRWAQQV